ncbi:hypothetical protein [Gottschalkia acidurici]|uniref:hypothetical protein n=1 Tax=Clostridium acidurici TaxID=1556 RepID=UPI000305693B|nr:hypothetical protein [Gottschalkia acidurici]
MEDKKTILIIALSTLLAIGITVYGERTSAGKLEKENTIYKSELYLNTNLNSLNNE